MNVDATVCLQLKYAFVLNYFPEFSKKLCENAFVNGVSLITDI